MIANFNFRMSDCLINVALTDLSPHTSPNMYEIHCQSVIRVAYILVL